MKEERLELPNFPAGIEVGDQVNAGLRDKVETVTVTRIDNDGFVEVESSRGGISLIKIDKLNPK
jgi:transcriptional regulator CtsR